MHRSKQHPYSITSLVRASSVGGCEFEHIRTLEIEYQFEFYGPLIGRFAIAGIDPSQSAHR
jgi:hypothetical protein